MENIASVMPISKNYLFSVELIQNRNSINLSIDVSTVGEFSNLDFIITHYTQFNIAALSNKMSILYNSANCKPGTGSDLTDSQLKSCSRWLDATVVVANAYSVGFCSINEFSIASSHAETDSGVLITLHRNKFIQSSLH